MEVASGARNFIAFPEFKKFDGNSEYVTSSAQCSNQRFVTVFRSNKIVSKISVKIQKNQINPSRRNKTTKNSQKNLQMNRINKKKKINLRTPRATASATTKSGK